MLLHSSALGQSSGPRLNIKTVFPGMIISYLCNKNHYYSKMAPLYWDAPVPMTVKQYRSIRVNVWYKSTKLITYPRQNLIYCIVYCMGYTLLWNSNQNINSLWPSDKQNITELWHSNNFNSTPSCPLCQIYVYIHTKSEYVSFPEPSTFLRHPDVTTVSFPKYPLKLKPRHHDFLIITQASEGCLFDSLWCPKWHSSNPYDNHVYLPIT